MTGPLTERPKARPHRPSNPPVFGPPLPPRAPLPSAAAADVSKVRPPKGPDVPAAKATDVPPAVPDVPPAKATDAPPAKVPDVPPAKAADAPEAKAHVKEEEASASSGSAAETGDLSKFLERFGSLHAAEKHWHLFLATFKYIIPVKLY